MVGMTDVFREGVMLRECTTLKIGGPARYFVTVETRTELSTAVRFAQQNGLPFLVIGGGSNILVADQGYPGVVIAMKIMGRAYQTTQDGVTAQVGAGETLDEFIEETVERGYWGLENLSAIPGTVGATPVQNVGAYGVEVGDLITSVLVYDTLIHEWKYLTQADCHFAYRESIFKTDIGNHLIVCEVTFALRTTPVPRIAYADLRQFFGDDRMPTQSAIRAAIIEIRSKKFPDWHLLGTAGSFFKNPIISRDDALALRARYEGLPIFEMNETQMKVSLGYILDKVCQLKGYRQGKLSLYDNQALVLVNHGDATAQEVYEFIEQISKFVFDATGIHIETEVRCIK